MSSPWTPLISVALLSAGVSTTRADDTLPVTVVVVGDESPSSAVTGALRATQLPVSVTLAELPNTPEVPADASQLDAAVASARAAYIQAEFNVCLRAVGDDRLVFFMLATEDRLGAARLLFWRTACLVGAGDTAAAERETRRFAVFGLDVPPDVASATPEVEAAFGAGHRSVEALAPVAIRVLADAPRAVVSLDGRRAVCVTPCTIDVSPGDHIVRVSADGRLAGHRQFRAAAGSVVRFTLERAPPDVAARQWTQRYASSVELDSSASVALLSAATRARRFVLFSADELASGARLRGVLAIDGAVAARAQRSSQDVGDVPSLTDDVLRELLVEAEVIEPAPPLRARPLFWIVLGVVVAGAVTTTALLLREPEVRTVVSF